MQITQYIAEKDAIIVAISLVAANSIQEVFEVMTCSTLFSQTA